MGLSDGAFVMIKHTPLPNGSSRYVGVVALPRIGKNLSQLRTPKQKGRPLLLPPHSILQNKGKTMDSLVLSLTAPLALLTLMSITKHSYVYVGIVGMYNKCTSIGL